MTRRKTDALPPRTKKASAAAKAAKPARPAAPAPAPPPSGSGARLRNEIVVPVGLGAAAMCLALGVAAVAADRLKLPLLAVVGAAAIPLVAGLMAYVAWVVDSTAVKPLARVRGALQAIEEGNYDIRLDPDGALELAEVQGGFNRMATIVGHQRERLKQAAASDSLTGLANHRYFHERLRAEFQEAREANLPLAVTALDIDGFKKLNEDRGHGRGDEALKLVADALERAVRGSDIVARLGGDDFMLILPGADPGYARDVSERAREAVARVLPSELGLSVSAGFACFPETGDDGSVLAEFASSALDVAKRAGGGETRKYDPDQVSASPSVRQQRAEIDEMLASEAPIKPVFQPLVELGTGRLLGFEALSRFDWEPRRPPDAWFNQATRAGRGLALEMAAIKAALAAPGRPRGTYLSLNFSPSALSSSKVMSILPNDMSDIVVEVTEHELASEDGGLEEGLAKMRARGARIAVDDAGAGYAGLNQVMRVQPDVIKLDRSLIEGVHADKAKAALVEFFVMFARRVGAGVCTEGIETLEELRALINLGVTYGQGYLLGRPAEPWAEVSPEITRALATGALRDHAATAAGRGRLAPAAAPTTVVAAHSRRGVPQYAGPVNRRLNRY